MNNPRDDSARPDDPESLATLRVIYAEASATMRHYSSLQFAIQTLYLASMGVLGSTAFLSEKADVLLASQRLAVWASGTAGVVSLFFFLLTLACERHREHFSAKARETEGTLKNSTVADVPPSRVVGATATLNWFYAISILFWLLVTIIRACDC